ncbi:MAG TPA: dihydropyrimidinase [Ktedonobacteraceae bacterium]|jgi:dihydropyrimidinase|nr:dihydropyrimidinase [Ktedonobacteraceae bacterium]
MRTLITNGHVVTATDDYMGDILVEDERIAALGAPGTFDPSTCDTVIDAQGKYVFPGAIDVHTHMELPLPTTVGSDDFVTGTIAAACGGTTTILDFANQQRGHSLAEALQAWHTKAEGRAAIDYGFHITITDLSAAPEAAMDDMISSGVTTFKLLMAYPNTFMVDDETMYRVLRRAARLGGLVMVHAENGIVIDSIIRETVAAGHTAPYYHAMTRPAILEGEATHRAITLAALTEAPLYVVHVTCAHSLHAIAAARAKDLAVWGETCPQYLYLDDSSLARPGFEGAKFVCSPPLRKPSDQDALWLGLQHRELQVVSTDHAAFNFHGQKELGRDDFTKIPNGLPGVEHRVMLMYNAVVTGKLDLHHFVDLVSTMPARLFGLFPRKGTIAPGSDADLVIFDPERAYTISAATQHQNVDYTPYEGMHVQGVPETVLLRGRVIVRDGQYVGNKGDGQYLTRKTFVAPD